MSVEEWMEENEVISCPDDYGYQEYYNIEEKIVELELSAIDGSIPTWYAYNEIDRLRSL